MPDIIKTKRAHAIMLIKFFLPNIQILLWEIKKEALPYRNYKILKSHKIAEKKFFAKNAKKSRLPEIATLA
jgi:hypothetical protein